MTDKHTSFFRGSSASLTGQALRAVLNVVFTAILARLLLPEDYGVFAMGVVLLGFLFMFKDMGLTHAIITGPEPDAAQLNTLFALNLGWGLLLAVCAALCGPLAAWVFNEPRLVHACAIYAPAFILAGLTVQQEALTLRRHMFVSNALTETVSMVGGYVLTITLVLLGYGYVSLFWMAVAQSSLLLCGYFLAARWLPDVSAGFAPLASVRPWMGYAYNLSGYHTCLYIGRTFDQFTLGWFLGPTAVGFYQKAYQLMRLPPQMINLPLSKVAYTILSQSQDSDENYRTHYARMLLLCASLSIPAMTFIVVSAETVVRVLLGQGWVESAWVLTILGPLAFMDAFNVATGWVFLSRGQTRKMFRWESMLACGIVAACLIGVRGGLEGLTLAIVVVHVGMRFPSVLYAYRQAPPTVALLTRTLRRPATASLFAGVVLFSTNHYAVFPENPFVKLTLDALLVGGCYVVGWIAQPGWKAYLRETVFFDISPGELLANLRNRKPQDAH